MMFPEVNFDCLNGKQNLIVTLNYKSQAEFETQDQLMESHAWLE